MSERCLLVLVRSDDPGLVLLRAEGNRAGRSVRIADVHQRGWRYEVGRPDRARAVADGEMLDTACIAAVVCRLQRITADDFAHLHVEDRAYAAAEAHAFLYAWLSQVGSGSFSKPTYRSLAGPGWHALQWAKVAARLGVPIEPIRWTGAWPLGARAAAEDQASVTVIGDEVIGAHEPEVAAYALRIARGVGSRLLGLRFVRRPTWKFAAADPIPSLDAATAAAVLDHAFAGEGLEVGFTRGVRREEPSCPAA